MNGEEMKLLGCPFCGADAEVERFGNARQSTIYRCTECSCMLETGEEWGFGGRWNTRAPINRSSPEAGESERVERHISHEEWRGIRITSYRWKSPIPKELQGSKWQWAYASHWSTKPDAERLLPFGPVSELVARLQAELAEARKERDEARSGERNMSEHVRTVSLEATDGFAALDALDKFWDAVGYPGNRGKLTPAEQVASIYRERDQAEAQRDAALEALKECADDLEAEILARASGELPRRIERDLEPVRKARQALASLSPAKDEESGNG